MSAMGDHGAARNEDAVETLLEQASPRPTPPGKDEEMIREAVFSEWQTVTGRRRTRTKVIRFVLAASVLLGVAVTVNVLQESGIAPVQVATIAKSHGSIHVRGEESQMRELRDLTSIMSGQWIITDHDSGIGLAWGNGGSLRIAADTRIEFVSAEEVLLHSGRIYFDSTPSELIANISAGSGDATLRILTNHGTVSHLGTQYMTYTSDSELTVSVREGEVAVDGTYHDEKVLAGQQLSIMGSARPSVANFPRHGEAWKWIEEVSPEAEIDGRSVDVFLNWVSRETGLRIEYADATTKQMAQDVVLNGTIILDPRAALGFWVETTDLNWHVEEGAIKVSAIDGSSGQ
jgi:hypothetical protein